MSWHGVLHEVGFALSFMGAIAACGVFARRYAALGRRGWAVAAVATVVAVLVIAGWPDLNTLSVRLVTATAACSDSCPWSRRSCSIKSVSHLRWRHRRVED